jgi:hypothetical protein
VLQAIFEDEAFAPNVGQGFLEIVDEFCRRRPIADSS